MQILLVGLNHRSAPIELRERLAFQREQLAEAFACLRRDVGVAEAAILSTCNRVEIYAGAPELNGTAERLHRFLSDRGRIELPQASQRLYTYAERQGVHHLFSVASGLDSMVLGEGEILHQVKHAYEWAKSHGATGKVLNALFQRALNAAKAVRSQTAIGYGSTSVGSVAIELAEKVFGRLQRARIALVGAGKIGELTLKQLAARGVAEFHVINRSLDRARQVAAPYGAVPLGLEALAQELEEADVIIASTSAPGYLLTREQAAAAMRARHQRPLCLIDLGVPRNIEPSAGTLENAYLFNVDDLQGLVDHAHRQRQQALGASQDIIDRKVERFFEWRARELHGACEHFESARAAAP